ncbi:uncharacterized protein EKO05_0009076 [Ascochyta rabiei]|uniref:Uncharacterized protein n=1 Tax=Didymella rabiei TaxID=5454 RepID=A0A163IT34_DIDRA|nr:uncharacterized protein EKO05_0009076 [Ascochyta rabiei]KZM25928.1 hypothetical protein ST47_g2874 [Ascochyta rabiei]UPX18784.1 hypothetical protein EKO05_0009076 [Ascochyta rabiei]
MARSTKYYNADDFDDYKRKRGKCLPARTNLLAAACHVQTLFDTKKFTFGFMGGFAMLCHGYKREMPDLHIAYDDNDFDRLRSKLESDQRVRLPTGVNPLLPFKILVWTGPEYKDQGCTVNACIELDLAPSGSCGTPTAGALSRNLIQLSLKTSNGQHRPFKCLNTLFLVATMLYYCKARDLLWDPRKDLLYLCKNESANMQQVRAGLNAREIRELFLGTSFFSRLPMDDQRLCYRILLDTDPPPIMAITPPAPQTPLPEHKSEARILRSRYRNVSEPRSSSSGTSHQRPATNQRPQSTGHLQDPRRLSHIVGLQIVNAAKPQSFSAVAAAKQARRSMPDLTAIHNATPALRVNVQDITAVASPRQYHAMSHLNNVPSLSTSASQYQNHASSQLEYGGSFQPTHMRTKSDTKNQNRNPSTGKSSTTSSVESDRMNSPGTPTQGIQSQKGSLHVVGTKGEDIPLQQYFQDQSVHPREGLHLVGLEEMHTASKIHHRSAQPQAQHQRHLSAPPPTTPNSVFELDITVPTKHTFVAELSAKPIVSLCTEHMVAQDHGPFDIPACSRPGCPRAVSVPLDSGSLPASLVAGGTSFHGYRQSLSHSVRMDESTLGFPRQTNAYRYSAFVFPQSETDKDLLSSSGEGTPSIYKAYRPSAVPDEDRGTGSLKPVDGPTHKRSVSDDSTASHDSSRWAQEYRDLLNFEDGYGSQ